jgi:putative ABC transport system permease protein
MSDKESQTKEMGMLSKMKTALRALLRRSQAEHELDEELQQHIDRQTEQNVRLGMNPEEARLAARKSFGGVELAKDQSRDARGARWIEDLVQDLHYGARMLAKNPGFTLIAVLTLALGIGANTAIFSIVNGVLLKALPYDQPDQLVELWEAPRAGVWGGVSPGAFLDWKGESASFESLSLLLNIDLNLTGEGEPERISGVKMSAGGLQILRARPLLGRVFAPDEEQPGKDRVIVLTHRLWQRRFGGEATVVGRVIKLSEESYTVIGVLPPNFLPWDSPEFIIPSAVTAEDANQRAAHWLSVFGRLKSGLTVEQARTEVNGVSARLRPFYPPYKKNWVVNIVTMQEYITGDIKPTLLLLLGAVGCVLLIACANVANLLLTRAMARQREMAIRAALGAGRWRVIRQLLTESLMLALIGAALGFLLAFWSVDALSSLTAVNLPRIQEVGLDLRVMGFALCLSLLSGLASGLAPAIQASKPDLNETLKESGRGSQTTFRKKVRNTLIVSEVALALVLLIGAGLLLNSFIRLSNVPPGINIKDALTMQISLPVKKYPDAERRAAFFQRVIERIENLSGIDSAGITGTMPLSGWTKSTTFSISGRREQPESGYMTDFEFCTPGYFRAAGIPLRTGRLFDQRDRPGAGRAILINETLAREYFQNEDPLGKLIHLEVFSGKIDEGWEIVGIVGDVRQRGQAQNARPSVYRPQAFSFGSGDGYLVIRTAGSPLAMAESVRKAILEIDPAQPVANIRTMEDVLSTSVDQRRFILMLLGGFAGASLLLAAIGLYGVIAYGVSQQRHEIGIRIAMGAQASDVLQLVIGQGMKLASIGVGIGLVGSLALTRFLKKLVYGISTTDSATFALIALLILGVALIASYIPARRATKVDPLVAIRYE